MAANTKRTPASVEPFNPDLIPVDSGVETWVNAGPSLVYLTKIGEYGRRESELVYGGKVFGITPQERRFNQSQCYDAKNDPFTNGTFKPLVLLDTEPDTERLRSNPNVLDDDRVAGLFKLTGEAFSQRLLEVTNATAVDRLIDIAKQPSTGASVQQLDILKRYRKLLAGENADATDAEARGPEIDPIPRAVTPR
jgi:hypothetical protein